MNVVLTQGDPGLSGPSVSMPFRISLTTLSNFLFCTDPRVRASQHKLIPLCVNNLILKHTSFILVFFKILLLAGTYLADRCSGDKGSS